MSWACWCMVMISQEKFQNSTFWLTNVDEYLSLLQYRRGHRVRHRWVFGLVNIEHATKPIFIYVPDRSAQTLLPLIQKYVPAGSTIVSDCWRPYLQIPNLGYQHLTVNHSRNFVDPLTGNHSKHLMIKFWLDLLRNDASGSFSFDLPRMPASLLLVISLSVVWGDKFSTL